MSPITSTLANGSAYGYRTLAAAEGSAFESIASATPTSATSVTFSSIPSTYKSLQLRIIGRSTVAGNDIGLYLQPNAATGSVYTLHELYVDGSTVYSFGYGTGIYTSGPYFEVAGDTAIANTFGVAIIDIIDYASTTKTKTMRFLSGTDRNGAGNLALKSSLWTSTDAITSLKIDGGGAGFVSGTTFALYGIKG